MKLDKEKDAPNESHNSYDTSPGMQASSELGNFNGEILSLSPSVKKALSRFNEKEPASAIDLAWEIFNLHPEYANGIASSIKLQDKLSDGTKAIKQIPKKWLDDIQLLFNINYILGSSDSNRLPYLNGRLMIIGLSLLEPVLFLQLEEAQAFDPLVKELSQPFNEILTEKGRNKILTEKGYNSLISLKKLNDEIETVPNWNDDPLKKYKNDLLGRGAFASYLVKRIAAIPQDSETYVILIYGPWGSGKSTLLNFISDELVGSERKEKKLTPDKWLIVEYNSWRNQHIQPPWWSLLDGVFQKTKYKLGLQHQIYEYFWRAIRGRTQYLYSTIIFTWILAILILLYNKVTVATSGSSSLSNLAIYAESISKILALLATIWGIIMGINALLFFGSARTAKSYNELTTDPTGEIRKHFKNLIKRLEKKGYRVAIFIDDLDRCHTNCVVELLEGIQTLFRETSAVFVIAADRRWLDACYEAVYQTSLANCVLEPGKSLGTLFSEKTFRFFVPIPGIPKELKERYWLYLLNVAPSKMKEDIADASKWAEDEIKTAKSEEDILELVNNNSEKSFTKQRTIREEAAKKMAASDVMERLRHRLEPYHVLLDPNPRSMKLLINAYSVNRVLSILSEVKIDFHQLVLWTILTTRWPQLASYLEEFPDMLDKIDQNDVSEIRADLRSLFVDKEVIKIVKGEIDKNEPSDKELKKETVIKYSKMHV